MVLLNVYLFTLSRLPFTVVVVVFFFFFLFTVRLVLLGVIDIQQDSFPAVNPLQQLFKLPSTSMQSALKWCVRMFYKYRVRSSKRLYLCYQTVLDLQLSLLHGQMICLLVSRTLRGPPWWTEDPYDVRR